jgi:hypothetical protein
MLVVRHLTAFSIFTVWSLTLAPGSTYAQNDNSWKRSSPAEARYGSTSGASPASGPRPLNSSSSNDITPIGGDPLSAGNSGAATAGPQRADVTKGSGTLPSEQGQVWRDYKIRPFTDRVANSERPEQAVIDWILRETGYEAWHSEPFGILSANRDTLRVYHTPEMQAVVGDIADRFVNAQASQYAFTLRVATVRNPNWRSKALPIMTPIPVQSPAVQGWLLAKENARLLISELTKRTDYREYNSPQQLVPNGQSIVISTMRPRSYVKGAVLTQMTWPGYQPEMGTLEEGFSLEFSPLLALDQASADAVVKLRLNQVEKMLPVKLDLPSVVAPNQRVQVDVPQMTSANLHERFRWPSDHVLLLSMGVVAVPGAASENAITGAVTDALPMLKDPPRADALLFIECLGQVIPSADPAAIRAAAAPQQTFQGRY